MMQPPEAPTTSTSQLEENTSTVTWIFTSPRFAAAFGLFFVGTTVVFLSMLQSVPPTSHQPLGYTGDCVGVIWAVCLGIYAYMAKLAIKTR